MLHKILCHRTTGIFINLAFYRLQYQIILPEHMAHNIMEHPWLVQQRFSHFTPEREWIITK